MTYELINSLHNFNVRINNMDYARMPKSVKCSILDLVHTVYTQYSEVSCMEFWMVYLYSHVSNFTKAMLALPKLLEKLWHYLLFQ